ncbi:MAG TPA: sigma-70 family RNA polymerase sigma factor, partial [Planctomycetota bacterium]|nr:sigma-70 family RNA polymerase sigma factor [Planctomycetota bacterium]
MNTPNPLLTADALLREGAALRALARRLLDDAAADDVVHDTYVAAMRTHAPHGSVGAWLGAIARRLALLARRRDARRTARERHVASRTAVPSAADAAATAEWMQLVATAVAELPDAQRTVVVLRFWHDLPPRAIAARLKEPLNTISSRLHRALVQLRERLDSHRERGAWIAGLAAFASGATVTTKANVLVGAAAAAVLAWLVWPAPAASLPPTPEVPAPRALAANDAPSLRDPAVAATSTVSGRCVTDTGAPVAGCRVGLIPMPGGGERPRPQLTSTDASGRFTLGPVPAGARSSMACLPGHLVAVEREWQVLPPGAVDVGDVCLPAGAQLVGMVRDAAGNGVGVMLDLELDGAGARSEGFVPIARVPVPSREDGVLAPFGGALAPGQWRIAVSSPEHVLRSAVHFTVAPQQGKVDLDVRVARLDEQPSIAGIAVSENGAPFADLTLCTKDGSSAQTGADGAFTIHCRGAATVPQRLTIASQQQLTLAAPDATYAWGSSGHRVVVRRPAGVWLHVVRADNGEPVTDYGIWLVPAASGEWSTGLRDSGHHEHGRVQLSNVRAGRYRVIVHPADPTLMPSDAVDAELGGDVALRIEVEPAVALL